MAIPRVLKNLLSLPTAAFVESAVAEYIETACRTLPGVKTRFDQHGNLLVHYRSEPPVHEALVFAAHMDHPGFVALRMLDKRTVLAAFRGWVEPEYFAKEKVRFWSGGGWVKARVKKIVKAAPVFGMIGRSGRPEEVALEVKQDIEPNAPGMWDLPDPVLKGGNVYARGCDDIAGCAALLAMIERVAARRAAAEFYVLFTRAEEVGFVGAIGAARSGTIPAGLPVIAIETSKAIAGVKMGGGPILRVGDKTSVFTPRVTAFCDRVARQLMGIGQPGQPPAAKPAKRGKNAFVYQRKLMDGGTCESTAYVVYGYPATGICVALGNYHNMNEARRKIAPEFISLADWNWMVDWFVALALDENGIGREESNLRATLDKRFAELSPLLAGPGAWKPRPSAG